MMPDKLIPTTLVGSYPQPAWLVDKEKMLGSAPPRVRMKDVWKVTPDELEEAQDDATLTAIHDQERAVLIPAMVVDLRNVEEIQRSDGLGFGQKPPHCRLASGRVSQHPLDGHFAVQPRVGRQQDLTHATLAERLLDLVPRQVHDLHVEFGVTGQAADVRQ